METQPGVVMGTVIYMSPEQALGHELDQRSDIFALGIVLFEMLAGQMPFHDESPLKLMLDVVQAPTPDIRRLSGTPAYFALLRSPGNGPANADRPSPASRKPRTT